MVSDKTAVTMWRSKEILFEVEHVKEHHIQKERQRRSLKSLSLKVMRKRMSKQGKGQ